MTTRPDALSTIVHNMAYGEIYCFRFPLTFSYLFGGWSYKWIPRSCKRQVPQYNIEATTWQQSHEWPEELGLSQWKFWLNNANDNHRENQEILAFGRGTRTNSINDWFIFSFVGIIVAQVLMQSWADSIFANLVASNRTVPQALLRAWPFFFKLKSTAFLMRCGLEWWLGHVLGSP